MKEFNSNKRCEWCKELKYDCRILKKAIIEPQHYIIESYHKVNTCNE